MSNSSLMARFGRITDLDCAERRVCAKGLCVRETAAIRSQCSWANLPGVPRERARPDGGFAPIAAVAGSQRVARKQSLNPSVRIAIDRHALVAGHSTYERVIALDTQMLIEAAPLAQRARKRDGWPAHRARLQPSSGGQDAKAGAHLYCGRCSARSLDRARWYAVLKSA